MDGLSNNEVMMAQSSTRGKNFLIIQPIQNWIRHLVKYSQLTTPQNCGLVTKAKLWALNRDFHKIVGIYHVSHFATEGV